MLPAVPPRALTTIHPLAGLDSVIAPVDAPGAPGRARRRAAYLFGHSGSRPQQRRYSARRAARCSIWRSRRRSRASRSARPSPTRKWRRPIAPRAHTCIRASRTSSTASRSPKARPPACPASCARHNAALLMRIVDRQSGIVAADDEAMAAGAITLLTDNLAFERMSAAARKLHRGRSWAGRGVGVRRRCWRENSLHHGHAHRRRCAQFAACSRGLSRRYPGARMTIACGPPAAQLFEAVPGLDRIIVVTKLKASAHWLLLWRDCVGQMWDLIVDLRGSALSYALLARQRKIQWTSDAHEHRVREVARLFNLDPPPAPLLFPAPRHREAAQTHIPPGSPVLAIGPAANWPAKTWPADHFAALVAHLTAPGGALPNARVAVFGGAEDRDTLRPVIDSVPARALHRSCRADRLAHGLRLPGALRALCRQRFRLDAHRRCRRHSDAGPVRAQSRRALRPVGRPMPPPYARRNCSRR